MKTNFQSDFTVNLDPEDTYTILIYYFARSINIVSVVKITMLHRQKKQIIISL